MALVAEARVESDLSQRLVGTLEQAEGVFDAQTAHVLADRAAVVAAEGAHEVRRVDARGRRDGPGGQLLSKVGVQELRRLSQPGRRVLRPTRRRAARQL